MDKSDFMHFVNSVRWHCTILMKTTGLNEAIDRAVRGVCDIRPEWSKCNFAFEFILEHLTEKIDGFYELVMCQSVIFGSLTLRNTNYVILG